MEFTQEKIDELKVNEVEIMKRVASELTIRVNQVSAVISLVNEGCTIPFISRYRKEMHGSLDEVQVRDSDHLFKSYMNLENRRLEIIKGIFAQGKLSESLYTNIMKAGTLTELEDIWLPFKKKKKTRGMLAIEKGLEPLADAMETKTDAEIEKIAQDYVKTNEETPELSVATAEEAIAGAKDILAERMSQDSENRNALRDFYLQTGKLVVKGVGGEDSAKTSVYQMYWDYSEPLNQIKPHRVLAINRGEREGVLEVTLDVDVDSGISEIQSRFVFTNKYHKEAVEDGVVRLLSPAVLREIRGNQSDSADDHGIGVFSENLKNLLMQQPIKGTRVLGVDPGIRTGTKCAALDNTGKYLGHFVIYQQKKEEAEAAIFDAIKKYDIQLVAVGNGTGTREVQEVVGNVLSSKFPDVLYTVVDEDGASVYSASDIARDEFPDLDLTIRGAISIGRRLQDPLAELVKIDPKSIGVGLYQHDVSQKKLSDTLDEVVGSVVNNVGVNLNTASYSLLKYVSGINSTLAKKIVSYRNEKGRIASREELQKVAGMGPKTFEQCAGFLKIPESKNPLDNTWVHPENYPVASEILNFNKDVTRDLRDSLVSKYSVGVQTIDDIVDELKKPNRDPRDGYPKPLMQKGVVTFEDLKEGMKVTGKIKNVVDFGAFVDIGIKETALLHISEISDTYVSDPMEVLKVGELKEFRIIGLDVDRRRISVSLKSQSPASASTIKPSFNKDSSQSGEAPKRKVVVRSGSTGKDFTKKNDHSKNNSNNSNNRGYNYSNGSDDGTMYNPFAQAFKNIKK